MSQGHASWDQDLYRQLGLAGKLDKQVFRKALEQVVHRPAPDSAPEPSPKLTDAIIGECLVAVVPLDAADAPRRFGFVRVPAP